MTKPVCDRLEFRNRFIDEMKKAGPRYGTPDEMQKYAEDVWESYWMDQGLAGETPEDCAEGELSEWGQE